MKIKRRPEADALAGARSTEPAGGKFFLRRRDRLNRRPWRSAAVAAALAVLAASVAFSTASASTSKDDATIPLLRIGQTGGVAGSLDETKAFDGGYAAEYGLESLMAE